MKLTEGKTRGQMRSHQEYVCESCGSKLKRTKRPFWSLSLEPVYKCERCGKKWTSGTGIT